MADLNQTKTAKKWQQYDPEDPLDFDMEDDELFFGEEDELDEDELGLSKDEDIPSWRRIEMAREDRFLREAMADFEDYDAFEDYGQDYSAGFSH